MAFSIDTTSYNKTTHLAVGKGYGMRPTGVAPTTILIHTTNNDELTTFDFEARYLYNSLKVSSHYLVGKDGRIVQIVPPAAYAAWHAGEAVRAFTNPYSIGIENHHSLGDDWPQAQMTALTWLVRLLMQQFRIQPPQIETHRYAAIPGPTTTPDSSKWRKHDPNEWPDDAFYAWRASLATQRYVVKGLPIYQRQDGMGPLAGFLMPGQQVLIDATYSQGTGHLADGRGFVDMDGLEAL